MKVLPISGDFVPTLREFKARYDIEVEMSSDFRRAVSRAYGVLIEERSFSRRCYFLIDHEGVLRWRHVEWVPGERRSNAELLGGIAVSLR